MNVKVFTTPDIVSMNADAVSNQRNRDLTEDFIATLDPNGYHVVDFHFLHNDTEIRSMILCKIQGKDSPSRIWLDCDISIFEDLGKTFSLQDVQDSANNK